ncbi:hypothetical protein EIP91_010450 [Steccherinum ochraceum]|uniref:Tyrosine specific protein phosphatases domain-containing protein n=1 Tax=Steccherinum ochraceum TaxID=92696 RepID=A0A4R0R9N2_9APHY|nr:hypothetical protein EIP91_010450 [Steccherinum ochraceum]
MSVSLIEKLTTLSAQSSSLSDRQSQVEQAVNGRVDTRRPSPDLLLASEQLHPDIKETVLTRVPYSDELKEDLHAALTSFLDVQPKVSTVQVDNTQPLLRTSETHPINISAMIPAELLHIISSNLTRVDHDLPVLFNVPFSFQLHRLLFRSHFSHDSRVSRSTTGIDGFVLNDPRHTAMFSPSASRSPTASPKPSSFVNLLWTQTFLRKAVIASSFGHGNAKGLRHSLSISSSISTGEPKGILGHQAPDGLLDECGDFITSPGQGVADNQPSQNHSLKRHCMVDVAPVFHGEGRRYLMGNLFLSSCPGKKGTVIVHPPISSYVVIVLTYISNLPDLRRMSEMGVRCIVCCLDDSELEFLGAPWQEYSRTADELGIDVLRIQIPEGLTPLDMEAFDAHLTRLIDTYTLAGRHVLVHCRGGVGRAGLVACCWTVKLGLCGWTETRVCISGTASDTHSSSASVESGTLQLVQRVLAVVRKQRSPKAIETFEQVKFLVDYVEYIRATKAAIHSPQV